MYILKVTMNLCLSINPNNYIPTYIHTYYVYIHTYTNTNFFVCMCLFVCVCMCACACVRARAHCITACQSMTQTPPR